MQRKIKAAEKGKNTTNAGKEKREDNETLKKRREVEDIR